MRTNLLARLILIASLVFVTPVVSSYANEEEPTREDKVNGYLGALGYMISRIDGGKLNDEQIDIDELFKGIFDELVDQLDDQHADYFTRDETLQNFRRSQGDTGLYGIGANIMLNESGHVEIIRVLPGGNAERFGLAQGDVITHVNGVDATTFETLPDAVEAITGDSGTIVSLDVLRNGVQFLPFDVVRGPVTSPGVFSSLFPGGILAIQVLSFIGPTKITIQNTINDAMSETEINGIILDLRNNPGGSLQSAIDVVDIFIPSGELVVTNKSSKHDPLYHRTNEPQYYDQPLAVLINGSSASASEIVAGGLQAHGRALVFGESSYGKGTVQTIIPMGEFGSFKMTTDEYFVGPNQQKIDKIGVTPDMIVEMAIPSSVDEDHETIYISRVLANFDESRDDALMDALWYLRKQQ